MTDPDLDAIQENISPTERQIVIDLTGGDTTNGDNVHEQTYPIVKEEPAQGHLQEKENLEKEEAPQLRPKRIKAPRQLFDPTVVGQYYNTGSEVFWDASATQEQIEAYEAVHGSPLDQEEEKANTGIQRDLQNLEFLESKTKTTDDKHCDNPASLTEALKLPDAQQWYEAAKTEKEALDEFGTWELIKPPPNAKVLPGKWVLVKKLNPDGTVDRYKGRYVICGNRQDESTFNPYDISSPVASYTTFRTALAIGAYYNMNFLQFDVSNAYLNADVEDEEILVRQPAYFEVRGKEDYVLKLKKYLYGGKQSGKKWADTFATFMETKGFR